ncbi:glycosyltransferase [Mesorhizobium sp. A623]
MNMHNLSTLPIRSGTDVRVGMLVGSISTSSGGVSEAVRSLSLALRRQPGVSVDIFSLGAPGDDNRDFGDIPVHLARAIGPASFGFAPELDRLLLRHRIDVLHVHGLWMYPSIAARSWARRTGRPYVVSPHGMLDPWALNNSAWKKRLARVVFEDRHLKNAAILHALCDSEHEAIVSAGIDTATVVLPNGVDQQRPVIGQAQWRRELGPEAKILLFLGRVTPKKQVAELIRAWIDEREPGSPWHLVLAGPVDASYRQALAEIIEANQAGKHVHMAGPVFGKDRDLAYASADAFVLPSLSEGLPMAALEAFAAGLPALLTPQCNLPEAFTARCALRMETDEASIRTGVRRLFDMDEAERLAMGARARRLTSDRFDWTVIAERFGALYSTLALEAKVRSF